MKVRFLILMMFLAAVTQPAGRAQTQGPLSGNQVMVMVKAGMETPALVKLIQEHGINFDLTDDYLEGLRKAGAHEEVIQALRAARPKPLTSDQVLALMAGGVPTKRAAVLVKEHGLDFVADNEYLDALRLAGADDELIAALREASAAVTVELVVATSPGANVYLDGTLQGKASNQGELALKVHPGVHALRVSLDAMKDFEQSVTLAARQLNRIEARLEPITAELVVVTLPGASLFLDGESQGTVGAQGEFAIKARPGPHTLKVSLQGKKDFDGNVMLTAQQATRIEARLEEVNPPALSRRNGTPIDWATQAIPFQGRNGQRFALSCPPGTPSKPVWGTGLYTDDSSVCGAAVHAGMITPGQGGEFTIEIRPGAGSYQGTMQNGVATGRYGRWVGSFAFVDQSRAPTPNGSAFDGATPASSFRGRIGENFDFICPPGANLAKPVWGTGLYTDDSSVCTAAVHAGVITPGQGGKVTIEIRPGARSYQGTRQNGVDSKRYGPWTGSFVFVP